MKKSLYYKKYGEGGPTLLFFHGFGQTHKAFIPLITVLKKAYQIYSFDLYYHGLSVRQDSELTKEEWQRDFKSFLEVENLTRFSIASFSLGGKFALATADAFPDRIDKLLLIAPDGIYRSPVYRLATSAFGRPLFKFFMTNPQFFKRLIQLAETFHLAPGSLIRFAKKELSKDGNYNLVYKSWTYFKHLQISPSRLVQRLNTYPIKLYLILGAEDKIIPKEPVLNALKDLNEVHTFILPKKHHRLIEGSREIFWQLFAKS